MKSYLVLDLVQPDTSLLKDFEEENFFYTVFSVAPVQKETNVFGTKIKRITILYQSFDDWARWKQISEPCLGVYLQHRFIEWKLTGQKI